MIVTEEEYFANDPVVSFLEHHGVKGMHWGIRKARGRQGRADRLQRVATSRPTRGNIRKAQRAQNQVDFHNRVARVAKGTDRKSQKKKKALKGAAVVGAVGGAAVLSSILSRKGMVPASQLTEKDAQIARIHHLIRATAHQNPVQRNAAANVRKFVSTL